MNKKKYIIDQYEKWHSLIGETSSEESPWQKMARNWVSTTIELNNKIVLDIGCGDGNFSRWLATGLRQSPRLIISADFANTAVAKARRIAQAIGIDMILYEVADILQIPHPANTFDLIFCLETIEHTISPVKAIKELSRVLKPNGWLVLSVPNYLNLSGLYRIYLRIIRRKYSEGGQPVNRFTLLPVVCIWLWGAGLRIVHVDGIGHYLPLPRPWGPIKIQPWDKIGFFKWFGLHSFIVAKKLSR